MRIRELILSLSIVLAFGFGALYHRAQIWPFGQGIVDGTEPKKKIYNPYCDSYENHINSLVKGAFSGKKLLFGDSLIQEFRNGHAYGLNYEVFGLSGITTYCVLKHAKYVAETKPETIAIYIGGNDADHYAGIGHWYDENIEIISPAGSARNTIGLVEELRKAGITVQILGVHIADPKVRNNDHDLAP